MFVSGYLSPSGCWGSLFRQLHQNGFRNTTCLQYSSLRTGIPEIADVLVDETSAAMRRSGTDGVHLIGYSLGGLVVRYAVQQLGLDTDTVTATTIATPHRGARLAYAGLGPAARQMRTSSSLLDDLPEISSSGRVRWSLVGSTSDRVVPISSATAGGHADAVSLSAGGHLGILDSPQLAHTVMSHLGSCETERRHPEKLAS
ncbi:esterase/lipase family protein [Streptomyces ochraceiscleroticus]|uniref:Esterase/lipase family protein n=1 Tax=Streptomyces ochraceiscleroticus TaxID=47761 RepID=A0ABW1MK54_9ACTN|nr:hypothetical protein [Streptomyces ochraceiscleroticus]